MALTDVLAGWPAESHGTGPFSDPERLLRVKH